MVNTRISLIYGIICSFCLTPLQKLYAFNGDSLLVTKMLQHLNNTNYEEVAFDTIPGNTIFLMITEKTCTPCYPKMEQYFRKKYPGYKVNIVIVMEDNPLLIRDKVQFVSEIYKGYHTIYFLFLNEKIGEDTSSDSLYQLTASPSPCFFTSDSSHSIKYWSHTESMKLIYSN